MDDEDKILLAALREGDDKVFDKIYWNHCRSIYHFVRQNISSGEDADELTQDIFVKLWQNSRKVEIVSLKNYLYTLARGTIIDYIRKNVNRAVFERLADDNDIAADNSDLDDKLATERLLEKISQNAQLLPERQREVYRLRWEEGLSRKEIAASMGITVTTVDLHLRKAIDNLRNKFTNTNKFQSPVF